MTSIGQGKLSFTVIIFFKSWKWFSWYSRKISEIFCWIKLYFRAITLRRRFFFDCFFVVSEQKKFVTPRFIVDNKKLVLPNSSISFSSFVDKVKYRVNPKYLLIFGAKIVWSLSLDTISHIDFENVFKFGFFFFFFDARPGARCFTNWYLNNNKKN